MTRHAMPLTALWLLFWFTVAQAQTYLPLVLGSDHAQSSAVSYGISLTIEQNRWLELACEVGTPVATVDDDGVLRVRCE